MADKMYLARRVLALEFEGKSPKLLRAVSLALVEQQRLCAPLTERESQVVLQAKQGRTRVQMSRELSLSVHTADNHLDTIARKLQVRRGELPALMNALDIAAAVLGGPAWWG